MKGINGYTGESFGDFTRGDTIPFSFQFMEADQITPIPVDGWIILISIDTALTCSTPLLEVTLTATDPAMGIISGEISNDESYTLLPNDYYISAKYVKPDGRAYMIDMGQIEVFSCVNERRGL